MKEVQFFLLKTDIRKLFSKTMLALLFHGLTEDPSLLFKEVKREQDGFLDFHKRTLGTQ